jgi:MFS family permease
MPKAIPSPNLTAVLALAAVADLVLYRLGSHVFLPSQPTWGLARVLSDVGLFMSNLGGVLGVVLIAMVLLHALRGDTIFPRSMRITVSTIGIFFVILSLIGVLALPVPDRYVVYLLISHAFLAALVAVGLWRRRCPVRLKLAVTLFAAPLVLQTATKFCERMGWSPFLIGQCARMAQASVFFGLLLAPVLVPSRPLRALQVVSMLGAGLIALCLLSLAMVRYFGLAQVVALYGLRFDLPGAAGVLGTAYLAMVVAAYTSVTVAAAACLTGEAVSRLLGYGLLLLATTGHQIVATNQTLFSLCGLCALALGAVRLGDPARAAGGSPPG